MNKRFQALHGDSTQRNEAKQWLKERSIQAIFPGSSSAFNITSSEEIEEFLRDENLQSKKYGKYVTPTITADVMHMWLQGSLKRINEFIPKLLDNVEYRSNKYATATKAKQEYNRRLNIFKSEKLNSMTSNYKTLPFTKKEKSSKYIPTFKQGTKLTGLQASHHRYLSQMSSIEVEGPTMLYYY